MVQEVPLEGLQAPFRTLVEKALQWVVDTHYIEFPVRPITRLNTGERDEIIAKRHTQGETVATLAEEYHLSAERIYQILGKFKSKK
jgi:Mor family transcriptional regulator